MGDSISFPRATQMVTLRSLGLTNLKTYQHRWCLVNLKPPVGPLSPCGLLCHVTGFYRRINFTVHMSWGDRCHFTPVSKANL